MLRDVHWCIVKSYLCGTCVLHRSTDRPNTGEYEGSREYIAAGTMCTSTYPRGLRGPARRPRSSPCRQAAASRPRLLPAAAPHMASWARVDAGAAPAAAKAPDLLVKQQHRGIKNSTISRHAGAIRNMKNSRKRDRQTDTQDEQAEPGWRTWLSDAVLRRPFL
jgi:hypothetical protein